MKIKIVSKNILHIHIGNILLTYYYQQRMLYVVDNYEFGINFNMGKVLPYYLWNDDNSNVRYNIQHNFSIVSLYFLQYITTGGIEI